MNSFDVRLPGVSTWDDGSVSLARENFNGLGVVRRINSPGATGVFRAIVGLPARMLRQGIIFFQKVTKVTQYQYLKL